MSHQNTQSKISLPINSLPNDKFCDWSKAKALEEEQMMVT